MNAFSSISIIDVGIINSLKDKQFSKDFMPIDFIGGGSLIISRDEQLLKAFFSIDFNNNGFSKNKCFNDAQFLNELWSIDATDDEIKNFDNDVHPKKDIL